MLVKWLAVLLLLMGVGCNSIWNGWLDPSQVGRFRDREGTMEILRSISVADEPAVQIDAVDPGPEDLLVLRKDYVLGPQDAFDVSILDFMAMGQPWVEIRQISEEGYISLPQDVKDIKAAGKTVRELEQHIENILQDRQILLDADVTILVRQARYLTYNIMGSVGSPGTFNVPRPDFTVRDALAVSGGITPVGGPQQPLIRTIYVFRATKDASGKTVGEEDEDKAGPVEQVLLGSVEQTAASGPAGHWVVSGDQWKFVPGPTTTSAAATAPAVTTTQPTAPTQPVVAEKKPADAAGAEEEGDKWEELAATVPQQRILAIPVDKLNQGDPRYNVMVRPGDTIMVPAPMQGEFYVFGNVLRPGAFTLTGRDITLRQAIANAGGIHPLGDPSRCELIRRIGVDREQILAINLDRIFAGKDSDLFLKPNDIVNVGSNPLMPFLAVLRNAFRMTYGFGFVYDRNFADIDSFDGKVNPETLRRQRAAQRGLAF